MAKRQSKEKMTTRGDLIKEQVITLWNECYNVDQIVSALQGEYEFIDKWMVECIIDNPASYEREGLNNVL